ncbi:MAG: flagellin, partial [Blastocatellia bacterium]|nr:flagellin [Blastocatellia bacterium]
MANFSLINNLGSQSAQAKLTGTNNQLNSTLQRLSSGLRINKSGDDAAGLAIANSFRSDISVLSQGVRNANDGISTLQIIDGGLNTISNLLDRAASLSSQSASGTFTGDRNTLQAELGKVFSEIDRQAQNIGLGGVAGSDEGRFNRAINVFIGGGASASAAGNSVSVDLSNS